MSRTHLCEHLLQLKLQKVANYFAKAPKACTGNRKHNDCTILGLCLTCGQVRCDTQDNQCTYQHNYGTKHPLIFKIAELGIYCFNCKFDVGKEIEVAEESSKKERVVEQYQKIMKVSDKLGERAEEMAFKMESKPKKEKKEGMKVEVRQFEKQECFQMLKKQKQEIPFSKYKLEVFGLKNLGNTCFFNSIIQCLYACVELHSKYNELEINTSKQFGKTGEINIVFAKYLKNHEKHFSPKSLFSWVGKTKGIYKHMDQQDSQEFLALFINGLIDGERFWMGVKPSFGEKITPTQQLFGFFLASRLQCLTCQKINWTTDFSLELAVQLIKMNSKPFSLPEGDIPAHQIKGQGFVYPPDKMSGTFLDNFFAPESLCNKNYYQCQVCKTDKAWRKFYLKDPPQILTISLKRFNNNLSKNNAIVRAPYQLDLQGHCINKGPLIYELFAISEHGGTARGGHYVAHTRRGAQWYYFSDSTVKAESWEKARSCQPYILFYRRIE